MDDIAQPESQPESEIDHDLMCPSCMGLGLQFPALWEVAQRYVRRGDDYHRSAGMKIIAEFAGQLPLDEAASLIERHFSAQRYMPKYGPRPSLDVDSFRAAVAVGLAQEFGNTDSDESRRRRMMAVVAQSLAVAKEAEEVAVAQRALRALLNGDPYRRQVSTRDWRQGLIEGRGFDAELVERCSEAFEDGRFDDAIRAAMIVLENRLRAAIGAGLDVVGEALATKAFKLDSELNFGQTGAEKDGLLNLFRAAFLLFRNPAAHRFADHEEGRAVHILTLVDLLLNLIVEANTRLYVPERYLVPSEADGQVRVEGVLLVDVDGDSEDERILVFSIRQSRLGVLVLRQVEGRWQRLNVEGEHFLSGFLRALDPLDLDGRGAKRVLVVSEARGGVGDIHVLEWRAGAMHIVPFDSTAIGYGDERSAVSFRRAKGQKPFEFRDADGDGILELYVTEEREFSCGGGCETVSYTVVYEYDPAANRFRVTRRLAFPNQWPLSDEGRDFLQSLAR